MTAYRQGRSATLRRGLRLALRLQGLRYTPPLSQLADELGVHERTIRRDLAALEEAGWPVPAYRHFDYPHGVTHRVVPSEVA